MKRHTLLAALLLALLVIIFLAIWRYMAPAPPMARVSYSDFLTLVHADKAQPHVESVVIRDHRYTFLVKDPKSGTKRIQETVGPPGSQEIAKELTAAGIDVRFEEE